MIVRTVFLTAFLFFIDSGYSSAQTTLLASETSDHGIEIPPMEFVPPDAKQVWRGKLGKSRVICFRFKKQNRVDDIVVLIRDRMPEFFKRIEYLDKGGDKALDYVKMKIYEKGNGWRDVTITSEHAYSLGFANKEYNEILEEIKRVR